MDEDLKHIKWLTINLENWESSQTIVEIPIDTNRIDIDKLQPLFEASFKVFIETLMAAMYPENSVSIDNQFFIEE